MSALRLAMSASAIYAAPSRRSGDRDPWEFEQYTADQRKVIEARRAKRDAAKQARKIQRRRRK